MSSRRVEREKRTDPSSRSKSRLTDQNLAKQRNERRRNRGASDPADWSSADKDMVMRLIVSASRAGGAVQFGLTEDGGSFRVGILDGGEYFKEFCRPSEDVNLFLEGIAVSFEE